MIQQLSSRDLRTLVIGLTSCTVIVGANRVLPHWRSWRDTAHERVEASRQATQRSTSNIMFRHKAAEMLAKTRASESVADSMLLTARTPGDGAAILASMASEAADHAHMRITTIQLKADSASTMRLARTTVRITGTTDIEGLTAVIAEIESDNPLVIVRELVVGQGDPFGADDRPEQLHVDLTVEALARVQTQAQPKKRIQR